MASAYPIGDDLKAFLYAANLIDSATDPTGRAASINYDATANAAKTEFERRTGRKFLVATASARAFDPPTSLDGILDTGEEFTSISSITWLGTPMVVTEEYLLLPLDAVDRGIPYNRIAFFQRYSSPVTWASKGQLVVTATWGRGSSIPDDAFDGILKGAAARLGAQLQGYLTRGASEIRQDDAAVKFDMAHGMLGGLAGVWAADFERVIMEYRRVGAIV